MNAGCKVHWSASCITGEEKTRHIYESNFQVNRTYSNMIWAGISDETWLLLCWRVLLHNVGSSFWPCQHYFAASSILASVSLTDWNRLSFLYHHQHAGQPDGEHLFSLHTSTGLWSPTSRISNEVDILLASDLSSWSWLSAIKSKLLCNNSYIALPLVDHTTFSSLPYPRWLLLTAWNHNLKRNQYRWPSVTGLK